MSLKELNGWVARGPRELNGNDQWLVTRFYPNIPQGTVALTAWGVLDEFEGVDEDRIKRFYEAYKGNLFSEETDGWDAVSHAPTKFEWTGNLYVASHGNSVDIADIVTQCRLEVVNGHGSSNRSGGLSTGYHAAHLDGHYSRQVSMIVRLWNRLGSD